MAFTKEEALKRHRAGDLEAAQTRYRSLLGQTPDDPDLLGLSGILELQKGNPTEAERVLRLAVAARGEPVVALRNLNALVVLLIDAGRRPEAQSLLAESAPDPIASARLPDAIEMPAILSLAEAMISLDNAGAAAELLAPLRRSGNPDARVLELSGRAALAAGGAAEAADLLEAAAALNPANPEPRIALVAAYHAAGRAEDARRVTAGIMQSFPLYAAPARPGQMKTILVVNPPPKRLTNPGEALRNVHFRGNYISQVSQQLDDRYRFVSVFPSPDMSGLLPRLPPVDLIFGNLSVAELDLGDEVHAGLDEFCARLGAPVVNHPGRTRRMARDAVAALLADCPGLRVPRTLRITGADARAAAFGQFPEGVSFPAILRNPRAHSSSGSAIAGADMNVFLANIPEDAAHWIGYHHLTDLYLIEYVDLERPRGLFRRFRAMIAGDEIHLQSASYYDHWLVGGWRIGKHATRFYDAHPECIADGAKVILGSENALGAGPKEALRQLRARIPLDLFGIDFDIDPAGRLVVFEVSPAMIFLPMGPIAEHLLPLAMMPDQINSAFERLIGAKTRAQPL